MIAGGALAFTRFCIAVSRPDVADERSAHAATTIAAPGAAALAHSASRIASTSSALTPGAEQLLAPFGFAGCNDASDPVVYCERPKTLRNVTQSARLYTSVSSITAIVCPEPVTPFAKRGLMS